jgi:hypothetical protein
MLSLIIDSSMKRLSFWQKSSWVLCMFSLLFSAFLTQAQAPNWQTVVIPGEATTGASSAAATAVDASGNVYTTGYFTNTIQFGETTLKSVGSRDVFVAKWSPTSQRFVWAYRLGGTGEEEVFTLAVDGQSIYVGGGFYSATCIVGALTLTNADTSKHSSDLFIAKLTDAGDRAEFVWAQRGGSQRNEWVMTLAVQGPDVYISGNFDDAATSIGHTVLHSTTPFNPAQVFCMNVFVAKLTDDGPSSTFEWAQSLGGNPYMSTCGVHGLAVSGHNVYVAGDFLGPEIRFGKLALANPHWHAPNGYNQNLHTSNTFVAKLTDAGATSRFEWVQLAAGASMYGYQGLAAVGTSIYLATCGRKIAFGDVTLIPCADEAAPCLDAVVSKLTDTGPAGRFVWAQRVGGTHLVSRALAATKTGVYIAGYFKCPTFTVAANELRQVGRDDIFLAKIADEGLTSRLVWAQRAGGPDDDQIFGLAISGANVYMAGEFQLLTTFGSYHFSFEDVHHNPITAVLATIVDPSIPTTTVASTRQDKKRVSQVTSASNSGNAQLSAYPNPAQALATAHVQITAADGTATLELVDVVGQLVRTQAIEMRPGAVIELPLAGLATGIYIIRVHTASGQWLSQKLVVE